MTPLPFAALVLEREPPTWMGLPVESYVQIVGGFAFLIMMLALLATSFRALRKPADRNSFSQTLFFLAFLVAVLAYAGVFIVWLPALIFRVYTFLIGSPLEPRPLTGTMAVVERIGLSVGGAAAIVAVGVPFLRGLFDLSFRRIWAITLLTIKEVVRRRILWVFALIGLLFLFGAWFLDTKPEDQLQSYVKTSYFAMAVLVLFTGGLLASFTIPTDIRQLTIHTVVTKPVEKFEIVLGRFLGHVVVMTAALFVMTTLSLGYVLRGVSEEAAIESQRARVPLTGSLEFENTEARDRGVNVGEEWDYRSYISGPVPGQKTQFAVWTFPNLPAGLASRPKVDCEFTFYIYRTTTGQLNRGVDCTFQVESWRWHRGREAEYLAERRRLRQRHPDRTQAEIDSQLAEKYGYFRLESKEVVNYHTQRLELPQGVFKNQLASANDLKPRLEQLQKARKVADAVANKKANRPLQPDEVQLVNEWETQNARLNALREKARLKTIKGDEEQELDKLEAEASSGEFTEADEYELRVLQDDASRKTARPPLRVRVNCESRTQFLGMAKYDLYLMDVDRPFFVNFYKGVVGIWLLLCLVIGVAVAVSTYCSAPITLVCVGFLLLCGLLRTDVEKVAFAQNEGGGPFESALRLFGRQNLVTPLEETTTVKVASGTDVAFRASLKPIVSMFPDVWQYDFSGLVASGFDVSWSYLALMLIYLLAYLLPWAVLAFYIIKVREIATW
jgi:hypothetical protein